MEIKHVKASEFNNEVLKSDKPVLVDFWADWCGPCKMLGPVLEQVAAKVDDVQIVKINVDEESSVAEKYNIMSIPTLLLFKNGECVAKSVGFISEGQVWNLLVNKYQNRWNSAWILYCFKENIQKVFSLNCTKLNTLDKSIDLLSEAC